MNVQYTRGWEDEAYFLNEESRVREGTDMTHLIAEVNRLPLSIDYVRPLSTGRLELGTRLQRAVDPGHLHGGSRGPERHLRRPGR